MLVAEAVRNVVTMCQFRRLICATMISGWWIAVAAKAAPKAAPDMTCPSIVMDVRVLYLILYEVW